jgi:dipeptidyl aminopeptidase/acylaminoacyl peptidase
MPTIADYGTWVSPITAEAITAGQVGLAQPSLDRGCGYWLEARPQEAGRTVLVRQTPEGASQDLTPPPFNLRTRVHEYGGGAYAVRDGVIVATNFADQRLYRIEDGAAPQPLTPASDCRLRYADFELDLARRRVLAIREDHRAAEVINTIVSITLSGNDEGRVLIDGHDFFSSPRLSPKGDRLAWLSWDHPDMPWDGTRLWSAEIAADGGPSNVRQVAGGDREAIVQPTWSPDDKLYFASDRSGWWNLYCAENGADRRVYPMSAEFAGPAWAFGLRWYGFLDPAKILACFSEGGRWHLGTIDVAAGRLERLSLPYTEFSGLMVEDGQAILRVGRPDAPAAIVLLEPSSGRTVDLCSAGASPAAPAYLASPESISYPSEAGSIAHAFYYPPTNPDFRAPVDEMPPLIVKSHGGPTGSTSSELRLSTQFWTSRGFAVCDVNYGGSTGYGRA